MHDADTLIRAEGPIDSGAIRYVHESAFGRRDEADTVHRIRKTEGFIPTLSLVCVQMQSLHLRRIGSRCSCHCSLSGVIANSPEVIAEAIEIIRKMMPELALAFLTYRTPVVEETDMTGMLSNYKSPYKTEQRNRRVAAK